tara:strand:- start:422437 stop:422901 length:465 start_codon:yes stop_codon:yes gene_type:complete
MKTILALLLLINISITNAQSNYAKDDNANGTSMMPIFNQAKNLITTLEEKNKLEIVKMEFDIVTAVKKTTWRTLAKDISYSIAAFGDYRVKDIDISVFKSVDGTWTRVIKDKKEDSYALVSVKPTKTEMYKIEISVYQFKDKYNAAHYGLFFIR